MEAQKKEAIEVVSQVAQSTSQKGFMDFVRNNWLLIVLILYMILPLDFIPDAIPVVGTVDDTALALIQLVKTIKEYSDKEK